MARIDRQEIIRITNAINKKEGTGTIYTLDSPSVVQKVPRWSTGIADLDSILGGGMPEGRTIEIYGPEGSGKTTLLYHLYARHELALHVPIEGTFESARAKVFGNHPKQLLVYRARFGEDAFNKTLTYSKSGMPIIGIDSVPSLVPKEDVEKMFKAADKDTIEDQRIGGVARLMEKYLPAIEPVIEFSGTTLIFINQVRDNMQAMLFGDKTRTPGGHRAKHSYSIRIQVARKEWIEIPNKDPHNTEAKEKVGFIMKCKTVKNKTADPMKSCELPCFFDRGFVSFDDIDLIRKELMKERAKRYK